MGVERGMWKGRLESVCVCERESGSPRERYRKRSSLTASARVDGGRRNAYRSVQEECGRSGSDLSHPY